MEMEKYFVNDMKELLQTNNILLFIILLLKVY